MKPLLIFEFDSNDYDPERADEFDKYIRGTTLSADYDVLVLWGGKAKVYYPGNAFLYYYQKLKAWLILKIWKNNIF